MLRESNQQEGYNKLCFLFGFFFNTEDGDDMFLRNVVQLSTDYMA
jgi:hypothetical protein